MQSYTIVITEVDEIEAALEELESQSADMKLQKNTIGIVNVNPEFLHSGAYVAVAAEISFPIVGITTYSQSANGQTGTFLMSILVLTSDDCEFAYGYSDVIPKEGDVSECTQECYKRVSQQLSGKVKLALLYSPYLTYPCASNHLKAISAIDADVPIYGSYGASDVMKMATDTRAVCGTSDFQDRFVIVLIAGNISPKFYIGSVADCPALIPNVGEVTSSEDNRVKQIDNIKASQVFEKIGFDGGILEDIGSANSVFIINEKDESGNLVPVAARNLVSMEDDVAVFGGHIPQSAYLSVAITTKDVIMTTARYTTAKIREENKGKTALIYTCLGRVLALLDQPTVEFDIISENLTSSGINYVAASSGGEICPTPGITVCNNEHNQTLVACVF